MDEARRRRLAGTYSEKGSIDRNETQRSAVSEAAMRLSPKPEEDTVNASFVRTLDAYVDIAEGATKCPSCNRETLCNPRISILPLDEADRRKVGQPRRINGFALTFSCGACTASICVNLEGDAARGGWTERWNWRRYVAKPPKPEETPVLDRSWADLEIPF
jgi:hypothetical protein